MFDLAPDFELKLFLDILPKVIPAWAPDEVKKAESYIRYRQELVRSGVERCPSWFQEELNRIDSRLRCWWDRECERWVIDRLQDEGVVERLQRQARDVGDADMAAAMLKSATGLLQEGRYYLTILQFQPTPELGLDRQLLALLKESDMQAFESPSAYLVKKRADAEKMERENDRQGTEKVLGAVDQMSETQLKRFIEVETAIATGETITAHGADAAFLERAANERREALKEAEEQGKRPVFDNEGAAINPGMHPRLYTRKES